MEGFQRQPWLFRRHINKLRWLVLSLVFGLLVLLPFLHVYQTFVAAYAYDLLAPSEKQLYDMMEMISSPFVNDPADDLDAIKGTTWSGSFFGFKISDPLAALSQTAAGLSIYWPFVLTAFIPVISTLIFGRFFCGWICPATLLYELNTNFGLWLSHLGLKVGKRHFDRRFKHLVLVISLLLCTLTGSAVTAAIYPPAIIGRELYYAIALGGFGAGVVFFSFTLLFDLLVARRGFCRYICPGGALYSLLGRYRLFRIRRVVEDCNDCARCNAVCEFGLDPLRDDFGQECNNCSACIAVCPTDALVFTAKFADVPDQGAGHLGRKFRAEQQRAPLPERPDVRA